MSREWPHSVWSSFECHATLSYTSMDSVGGNLDSNCFFFFFFVCPIYANGVRVSRHGPAAKYAMHIPNRNRFFSGTFWIFPLPFIHSCQFRHSLASNLIHSNSIDCVLYYIWFGAPGPHTHVHLAARETSNRLRTIYLLFSDFQTCHFSISISLSGSIFSRSLRSMDFFGVSGNIFGHFRWALVEKYFHARHCTSFWAQFDFHQPLFVNSMSSFTIIESLASIPRIIAVHLNDTNRTETSGEQQWMTHLQNAARTLWI